MRSTFFFGFLLCSAVYVHGLTRLDNPVSIRKRAASPQLYTPPRPNANNQTQQFQWQKVNNQWVRSDGTKLPGYSQANVPYNQSGNQGNTIGRNSPPGPGPQPAGSGGWGNQPPAQQPPQGPPQQYPRQNSTSQGGIGWNPSADRALTQDLPRTTPRPVYTTTTQRPVIPQTPPPAYKPAGVTPSINAPFGSGVGGQQGPPGRQAWNPDASLTYATGGRNVPTDRNRAPQNPNAGRVNSNPWGGLSV